MPNSVQVMLRNIPNKVDQAALKEFLDETSFGLYNFLYLRIGKYSLYLICISESNTAF